MAEKTLYLNDHSNQYVEEFIRLISAFKAFPRPSGVRWIIPANIPTKIQNI